MADEGVLLSIAEMIDLSIGTPEVGVVDFCMLHTVLHCLAQQLRCENKNVELKGSVGTLPVGAPLETPQLAVNEFIISTDGDPGKAELAPAPPPLAQETMLVVERIKRTPPSTPGEAQRAAKAGGASRPGADGKKSQAYGKDGEGGRGRKTRGADAGRVGESPSTEKLSLVTASKFNILEKAVRDLKNRVYGSMPKNEDLLEEVRSQTNMKSISDMWTSLNVSSRLEAVEEGLGKLSSLVQDLIGESAALQGLPSAARYEAFSPRSGEKGGAAGGGPGGAPGVGPGGALGIGSGGVPGGKDLRSIATQMYGGLTPEQLAEPATKEEMSKALDYVQGLHNDLDSLTNNFYNTMHQLRELLTQMGLDPGQLGLLGAPGAPGAPGLDYGQHGKDGQPGALSPRGLAPGRYQGREGEGAYDPDGTWGTSTSSLLERLNALEKKLNICCDSIKKADGEMHDQLSSFQDQLDYLAKQVHLFTEDMSAGKFSPDFFKDVENLMELFQTVQGMQEQLAQVHETALQLAAEKDDRQQHLQFLLEQIELLKMIKLDREDMEEALAEKADLRMLARKVSHDQFEMACDDLSRGLEDAIGKLNIQEALWQQALDDIQREIETKLDKMELSPLKDFFLNKLKQLQNSLKQMAALRREVEAAGTRKRLLTDVNCLSCDAKVVMSMDPSPAVPSSKPLPPMMSMKPYLSYELDAIRRAQASNVQHRNMHDWETIERHRTQPKPLRKIRSETDKHICNRYCGGSHTVTTPAQRVARLGHFIKQWGPEVLPLSSGLATGDDGRLYKVSTVEGASVGPGGAVDASAQLARAAAKKSDAAKLSKPLVITAECRCLEDDLIRSGRPRSNYGDESARN